LELADGTMDQPLLIQLVEVIGSQIVIGLAIPQDVVDDHEHTVGNG
jgi:hypothetical protein